VPRQVDWNILVRKPFSLPRRFMTISELFVLGTRLWITHEVEKFWREKSGSNHTIDTSAFSYYLQLQHWRWSCIHMYIQCCDQSIRKILLFVIFCICNLLQLWRCHSQSKDCLPAANPTTDEFTTSIRVLLKARVFCFKNRRREPIPRSWVATPAL
jgi:hypothetical protein